MVGDCDARSGGGSGAGGERVRLREVAREVGVPRAGLTSLWNAAK